METLLMPIQTMENTITIQYSYKQAICCNTHINKLFVAIKGRVTLSSLGLNIKLIIISGILSGTRQRRSKGGDGAVRPGGKIEVMLKSWVRGKEFLGGKF